MADPADIGIGDQPDKSKPKYLKVDLDPLAGPDGGAMSRRLASFWINQVIDVDDDREFKRWLKRGTTIEKRYRDERSRVDEEGQRHVNSLWANVEILTPALYGRPPVPVCERRFRDKDPVGRGAAQMLERALRNEMEICGFDESMRQALRDYLLPGRGSVWVRYEPEFGEGSSIPTDDEMDQTDSQGPIESPDESEEEEKLRETGIRVTRESTPVDYIQWTDFYTFPSKARIWKEVTAVGKRVYMTREQMKRRFGDEIGRAIPFQKDDRRTRRQEDSAHGHAIEEKAQIFEIWDRTKEEVVWIAEGYHYLCDRKDDPLKLESFFPCPKPLYANPTNNTLVPVPDFIQYQDQAIQIDELTQRISMLAKACKVAGVYNSAAKGIQRLFNESVENEMIPVDDWAAFAEKGGIAGNLSFIPLKEIMGVIEELTKIKERALIEMDRLTGINDIMRGTTDARETLGGQRLKSNASGTRLQARQNEVVRFARDVLKIMADIMCRHFSAQSLIEVSGALYEQGLGTMDVATHDMLLQTDLPSGPVTEGQGGYPTSGLIGTSSVPGGPGGSGVGPGSVPPRPPGPVPPGPMPQMPGGMPPGGMPGAPMPGMPPTGLTPGMPSIPGAQPPGPPPIPGLPARPTPPAAPSFGFQGRMPPNNAPSNPGLPTELIDKIQGFERIARSIRLIRDEKLLGFRVEIEVESTIYADTQQEKADRTAFIASVTQFLQQSMVIGAQLPQATPLLGKFLQFGVRGFNIGRELEQAIEDFCDEAVVAAKMHQQMAQQMPNPMQMKAQADMMKAQADIQGQHFKIQSDQQKAQAEVQRQHIENQGELQNSAADTQQKQLDMQMRHMEMEIELIRLQIEKMKAQAQLQTEGLKAHTAQQQSVMDQHKSVLDMQGMHMQHAQDQQKMQMQREEHDHNIQSMGMEHNQEQQKMHQQGLFDQQKLYAQQQQHDQDLQMQREQQQHEIEQGRVEHNRSMEQGNMQHKLARAKLSAANKPRSQ
jgi:hypothetical protein